jgi:hypothetical protein
MSDWSWKQTVAERIIELVNTTRSDEFDLDDVYGIEPVLRARFPPYRFVRQKLRQTLQRLRDMGMLTFLTRGRYRLNLQYAEFQLDASRADEPGIPIPETRAVVRRIRLRDTLLAADMKRRYENLCQVCKNTIQLSTKTYAESHHIRPLGAPHFGPDTEGNIVVVCPNHHVMFDRGALSVDPQTLLISHVCGAIEPRYLFVLPWHRVNPRMLTYHQLKIRGGE